MGFQPVTDPGRLARRPEKASKKRLAPPIRGQFQSVIGNAGGFACQTSLSPAKTLVINRPRREARLDRLADRTKCLAPAGESRGSAAAGTAECGARANDDGSRGDALPFVTRYSQFATRLFHPAPRQRARRRVPRSTRGPRDFERAVRWPCGGRWEPRPELVRMQPQP